MTIKKNDFHRYIHSLLSKIISLLEKLKLVQDKKKVRMRLNIYGDLSFFLRTEMSKRFCDITKSNM